MILFFDKNIFITAHKAVPPLAAKTVLNNIFGGVAAGAL